MSSLFVGVGPWVNIPQLNAMASVLDSEYVHLVPDMATVLQGVVMNKILDHACEKCSKFFNKKSLPRNKR